MAQYGGDQQYRKEEGHQYTEVNPLHSTTAGHQIGSTGTAIHSTTAGHEIGGTGTTIGTGAGHGGYEQEKHAGGVLHRSGSGSSSSESDGEGGRRKKKGVVGKIKEKLPGGTDHGAGGEHKTTSATVGYEGEEAAGHEKKGLMEKIKEKLPGGHH